MRFLKILGIILFASLVFITIKGFMAENIAEINETEPQKIARELVRQEMGKQVGLEKWKITENEVTSDKDVQNISDYDKPVGDMRIVWIEGNVKAIAEDGSTGNVGYDLELYQMKGDSKWYIGNHMGVLINLVATEKPNVKEDEKYLSDSEELPIPEQSSQLQEGKSVSTTKSEQTFTEDDLKGAWHWSDSDDFYLILRNDDTFSYIEKNAGFFSEGTYTIDKVDDQFKVTVHYTTGQYDSIMTIKLIDKNHLEGNENNNSWKAERIDLADSETVLNDLKEK